MGRIKIAETYSCSNCRHEDETDSACCIGCHAMDKDVLKPRGWEALGKVIPLAFDATAFIRAVKGQPCTRLGINTALRKMIDNLELQRMPYYTMTRVHLQLNNVPAVYVDDGKKSLVVVLNIDEYGKCTGKM